MIRARSSWAASAVTTAPTSSSRVKSALYQFDAHVSQTIQLGSFAAIAARHPPASGHQLLAQIESCDGYSPLPMHAYTLPRLSPPRSMQDRTEGPIHRPVTYRCPR